MKELAITEPILIGREEELSKLKSSLDNAIGENGFTTFIAGEAGIGKSRLVSELKKYAEAQGVNTVQGWCLAESLEPLMPIKTALREARMQHLISGDSPPLVVSAYLMNEAGMLISQVEREDTSLDSDIFAGMLQAVGNFVQDSLSMMDETAGSSLNSLGYGDYTILIQSTGNLSLATVIKGTNSEFLIEDMKTTLNDIGDKFDDWAGDMTSAKEALPKISWFVESGKFDGKFLVDDPKIKQENLFDNILLGIQRASSEKPILLFLDDLQWSDPTTLNLVHYLSRNTRKYRVLILGTYRPEDIVEGPDGSTHYLETSMQGMSREDLLEKIELKRLDSEDTEKIVESMLSQTSFEQSFFDKIYRETDGSPFFILEVVKLMIEDEVIKQNEKGIWQLVTGLDNLDVPSKVYDVIKRRLNRLMNEQKEILECASVIGEEFKSGIVGNVVGLNKIQLLKNLSEIEKTHHLIHYLQDKYRFDHAKVKEVLYNGIGEELRGEYHRMVGDAIAALHEGDDSLIVPRLAYHYSQAKDDRAAKYLVEAGDMAKERYANEEATSLFINSLEFVQESGQNEIIEKIADLQLVLGEYDSAIKNLDTIYQRIDENAARARMLRKKGNIYERKGDYAEALRTYSEAHKDISDERSLEYGRISFGTATAHWRRSEYEEALSLFSESISIFENLPEAKKDYGNTLRGIGNIYLRKGEYDKALEYYEESREVMRQISEMETISALGNIGIVHAYKGELDKALDYFHQSLELKEKTGDKQEAARMLLNIGSAYQDQGDIEKAMRYHEKSGKIFDFVGDKWGIALSNLNMGQIYNIKGESEKAIESLQKALKTNKDGDKYITTNILLAIADAHITQNNFQFGLEFVKQGLDISVKTGFKVEEGNCHNLLGKIHFHKKEIDSAIREYDMAMEIFKNVGDEREHYCSLLRRALVYKETGETDKAREDLKAAFSKFKEFGMKTQMGECKDALDELK